MLANCKIPLLSALLLFTVGVGTENCFAQLRRYQPSRPTTSSYLNLTRLNTGVLPNYHALVRPAQRQRAFNLQEQALRKQQGLSLQRLQNDVQQGLKPVAGTGKRGGFLVPSSRSGFGTSGQYFRTNLRSVR